MPFSDATLSQSGFICSQCFNTLKMNFEVGSAPSGLAALGAIERIGSEKTQRLGSGDR